LEDFPPGFLNAGGSYSFSGQPVWRGLVGRTLFRAGIRNPAERGAGHERDQWLEQILGTVSAGTNWSADLEAGRASYSAANPCPDQGKFTVIFGYTNNGAGYGTVKRERRPEWFR